VSCGARVTACWFVGSFDENAVLELRAGTELRDEVGGIDGTPAVLCRLEEFERHRDSGAREAGPLVTRGRSRTVAGSLGLVVRRGIGDCAIGRRAAMRAAS